MKYLDDISESEIVELNIPTGIPLVYELDDDLKPIRHYYLGDPAAAAAAAAARSPTRPRGDRTETQDSGAQGWRTEKPARSRTPAFGLLSASFYSTGSAVSSAAIRSDRRKRRSFAVTSKRPLRLTSSRAGAGATLVRAAGLRAVDEPDDGFERDLHFETRGARLLAARFDLRILRDRGGNRVGQLSGEPVHDVVHPASLLRRRAGFRGASRSEPAYTKRWTGIGRLTCASVSERPCR